MGNPFRRALALQITTQFFVVRKRVKYRVLTLFRAEFVAGAPVRNPKYWKDRHDDADTSRYQEIQFRYRSLRKCLKMLRPCSNECGTTHVATTNFLQAYLLLWHFEIGHVTISLRSVRLRRWMRHVSTYDDARRTWQRKVKRREEKERRERVLASIPTSFTSVNESWHTCKWITSHVWICHVTGECILQCHTCKRVMSHM